MARGEPFWLLALLALFGDKAKKKPVVVVTQPPVQHPSTPTSPFPNLGDLLGQLGKVTQTPKPAPSPAPAPKPAPSPPAPTLAKSNGPLPANTVRVAVTHAPSDVATWIVEVRDSHQLGTWDWTRDPTRPEYIVRSEPQSTGVNQLILYGISHAGEGTPSGKGRGGT